MRVITITVAIAGAVSCLNSAPAVCQESSRSSPSAHGSTLTHTTRLAQWPQWRGPLGNGMAAASAAPPIRWSATENLQWQAPLAGTGASTPIVWREKLFVLSARATGKTPQRPPGSSPPPKDSRQRTTPPDELYDYLVTCLDRRTGKQIWQRIAITAAPHEGHHRTHTYAGGSPVTDGQRLIAPFGSHGIFAYSLDGELLWHRDLGQMRTRRGWGEAITPALSNGRVVVSWDHEDDSYLYALDVKTGATLWRKDRPGEVTSWNTPLCVDTPTGPLVVVNGTGAARAYDLETGNVRWWRRGQTVNAIPTPLPLGNGHVFCSSGYRGQAGHCIRLLAEGDADNATDTIWQYNRDTPYVPSPSLGEGLIYFTKVNDPILTVLKLDGSVHRRPQRLSGLGSLYASPLWAAGRLYLADREGTTLVLDAKTLEVLATNRLPQGVDASPVAVGRQLLLRSIDRVYCISAPRQAK